MTKAFETSTFVPRLAEAALGGDRRKVELLILSAIRSWKREQPEIAQKLGQLLAQHSINPGGLRWHDAGPPPAEREEGMALVRIERTDDAQQPVLSDELMATIMQFIKERQRAGQLLQEGFAPPASILLVGKPGTGKTMLARWLSMQLELPLITQDLAASMSSYLGKTGQNIRRILDYARGKPCVLLLDEFDAIAKRRDDQSDVGELKRIVNVLLKELEDWPLQSVVVAATNHSELLDPAISRRFDLLLTLSLPGDEVRRSIMERSCGQFASKMSKPVLDACCRSLEGSSGSDISALMQAAVRRHLTTDASLDISLVMELQARGLPNRTEIGLLIRRIYEASDSKLTVRQLAELFGKSASTIQHHLSKDETDA